MAQTQRFDELNNFFSVMELPDIEKEKRVVLADAIFDVFMYLFMWCEDTIRANKYIDSNYINPIIETRLVDALNAYDDDLIGNYPELQNYPKTVVKEIVDTTIAHIVPIEVMDDGTIVQEIDADYFLSQDRAMTIAKNEANTVGNAVLHAQAIDNGFEYKTWITMRDESVRETHKLADGQTVGINENFRVGIAEMPYPRYWLAPAEETVNCRCTVEYF